ncbi:MAG: hypothetical protein GYA59_14820 [Chloroflexi bacterium]|jgi:hypothetical protein|nr:hypothetical protein [Chloroflexota bacterium]
MQRFLGRGLVVFIVSLLLLGGCAQGNGGDAAAKTVEAYLQALVDGNTDQMSNLSCKDWEQQAMLELDSFQGVEASLADASCKLTGSEGDTSLVECQGKIQATYNNEQQEFDLGGRVYQVVKEGGDLRVCGYR